MGKFIDEPTYKGKFLDEPEVSVNVDPIKLGIKTAVDPLLSNFGLDSRSRETQKNNQIQRENVLNSNISFFGKDARSSFSDSTNPVKVPLNTKITSPLASTVAESVSNNLTPRDLVKEVQGVALDTAVNLGTDLALAKGPKLAASALKKASGVAESAGGRFLNFYIKPRAAGYKFGKIPGRAVSKHIGPTLRRENLLDKVTSKKQELLNLMEAKVSKASKDGTNVDAGPIFEELQKAVNMMMAFPDTYSSQIKAHKDLAGDILRLASDSGARGEGSRLLVDPSTAVKIKRALGELPSWNVQDPKLGSVSKSARRAYGRFDKEIDAAVPETAEMNNDISELIGAQQGLELGSQREQNKSPVGLIDLAFGGLGSVGGPVGMAKGIALSKFLRSAPFNTSMGAAAGGVAKAGKSAAKTISRLERPSLLEEAFKSLKQSWIPKDLETVAEKTYGPEFSLGRNKASTSRSYLPSFSSSKPPIPMGGKTTIQIPPVLESDLSRMAGDYGIPTYAPPKQVITEIPSVPRGASKSSWTDMSEKERGIMERLLKRRKNNFKG